MFPFQRTTLSSLHPIARHFDPWCSLQLLMASHFNSHHLLLGTRQDGYELTADLFASASSACQNLKDSDILNTVLFVKGVGWLPPFRMFESNYSLHDSSTIPVLNMNCLTFKLFIRMVPRYAECGAIERTVMIMKLNIAGWQDKHPCCPEVSDKNQLMILWPGSLVVEVEAVPG